MKIGILTFHRACNYGAVLQCYALQEALKALGHEVYVIDYRQPYIEQRYNTFNIHRFLRNLLHPRGMFLYVQNTAKRFSIARKFDAFRRKYLCLTNKCSAKDIPEDLDRYIIGSDQLWGLHSSMGTDSVYFGNFKHKNGSSVVSYAISADIGSIEGKAKKDIISGCNNIERLSFREAKIAEKISERSGKDTRVDVDPTLLTTSGMWDSIIDTSYSTRRYVLLYQVRYPIRHGKPDKTILYDKAVAYAKSINCELINVSPESNYSPSEFVSLIKYARAVITSSFHACAFSIIFQRPLYAFMLNDGKDLRYTQLLQSLGMQNCLFNLEDAINSTATDWVSVESCLVQIRDASLLYLKEITDTNPD